ncbi:MAG TPA: universal stress protein [Polyangiaceae bacterium]|jgi:nucleotide-binding universal stress UspA family protein|nr:universal stress protein [Polyangiaceae bacterium]
MTPSVTPYRVIAALDFSELSDRALEAAIESCNTREHAEVHAIVVGWTEPGGVRMPGPDGKVLKQELAEKAACEHVERVVNALQGKGRKVGVERIAVYVAAGEPAERICALADSVDADLIVVGTHGRKGVARWVLGSVAEEVTRRASTTVCVLRPKDFLRGEHLPAVEPPLAAGAHSLKPFHHSPTYHYVQRADRASSRVMPIG